MRWIAFASVLAAYAVTLVTLAPATLIDAQLERVTGGRVRLAGGEGTLWSGKGWIEIREAHGSAGVARHVAWRVRPGSLLAGRVTMEVELDRSTRHFPVSISGSRVVIRDAAVHMPASALGLALPRLAPLGLTGEMQLSIAHLSLARRTMEGEATLQWRAAGSALTSISPLGDYEVRLNAAGSAVHAAVTTIHGPLQLAGKGTWSNGAEPTFLALAHVPAPHREQLSPLLRLIAIEREAGSFELRR